ncbi:MAG: type IV pilus secretin PilQ [Vicinamibacterales bacterium]
MTATRGLALILSVATAGALVNAAAPPDSRAAVRLKAISARVGSKGASLVIEATEPVAYTMSRPDPLTLLLDFRNVAGTEVANSVAADVKSPIAHVSVEAVESLGAPASRVRIALSQPVAHHVRSERNTIVVDFDKPFAKAPYVLPPATRNNRGETAPDAMLALQQAPTTDPIAALGLDTTLGGPSAAALSPASTASPQPVVAQSANPLAARLAAVQAQPAPAATPPPSQALEQQSPGSRGRQFTGHPISLDFQGADLRAVLRTFAEISGLNIVIDPAVQGTVDVALRDVPWDQALDIILRGNKLGYSVDGTIVRIAPNTVLKSEEDERKALLDAQNDASQLGTLQRQLSYAKGEEVAALLKSANVLSKRGQANVDPRTNTLIVRDVPSQFPEITSLIDGIDRAQPQVEIEARIVQTNKTYARALGVQWGFGGRVDPSLGNTTNLAFPNSGSLGGRTGAVQGPATGSTTVQPTAVNLGVNGATSGVGLALGSVNGAFNLDVALSALESSGNGRLLSTPRVTTQNNVAAEMTQGVQIPIQTVSNNTVTVSFKDAALTLKVTPQITSANTVIMLISVENATPDFSRQVNNIPPINTQRANTQVLVSDGQTTVIGGIYVSNSTLSSDKTPGLGNVPLLKWLFKRDRVDESNSELLIFITPRIIKS